MNYVGKKVKHNVYGVGEIVYKDKNKVFVKFENKSYRLSFSSSNSDFSNFFTVLNEEDNKAKQTAIVGSLITDNLMLIELIKTVIITSPFSKQIYTANELKEILLKNYGQNPGNMISREVLINVCKDLYEEEQKHYYVSGDGNTLQIIKASSFAEWKKMALGNVYIPTVQINDKECDIKQFTLYVYESLNKTRCINNQSHRQENVTVKAKDITGVFVRFNAFYCSVCKRYYTTIEAVENNFYLKSYPLIRMNFCGYSEQRRRDQSELMMYGYSVKADGLSEYERQNLLAMLMNFNILSKAKIIAIIQDHINYNGRAPNMESAVSKWKSDLDFVQNFNINSQREIKTTKLDIFYKGKRNQF